MRNRQFNFIRVLVILYIIYAMNSVINNVCVDANDEDVENLHFSNIDEQYVDVSSIKSLAFNNTSTSISVMCVNMRSLANLQNFSKLEALICSIELKPDIIPITETWTRPYISGPYNSLCGYNFASNCRKLSMGGGVGSYCMFRVALTFQ